MAAISQTCPDGSRKLAVRMPHGRSSGPLRSVTPRSARSTHVASTVGPAFHRSSCVRARCPQHRFKSARSRPRSGSASRVGAMFMVHGRLAALPGMREELLAILQEGAGDLLPGCRLYVVAVDESDPDGVWATEIWETPEAHAASLQIERLRG